MCIGTVRIIIKFLLPFYYRFTVPFFKGVTDLSPFLHICHSAKNSFSYLRRIDMDIITCIVQDTKISNGIHKKAVELEAKLLGKPVVYTIPGALQKNLTSVAHRRKIGFDQSNCSIALILPRCHGNPYDNNSRVFAAKCDIASIAFSDTYFASSVGFLPSPECYKVSSWLRESLESVGSHSSCKLNA